MSEKFYVLYPSGRCDGPYSFRLAWAKREELVSYGEYPEILKLVVDVNGNEVK